MATSYAPVLLQLFDNYAEILAGGLLHTFEAGTTTELATYQDLAGSTPNTNPVVLDAAGRATVRLTNGVAYKFILMDADGNTIATQDNIIVGELDTTTTELYPVHFEFLGTPDAGQVVGMWILESNVTFPANFTATGLNSSGSVKANPTASYVISVQIDGDEKGTITIGTDGFLTFATTGAWSGVKYDQIDLIGDAFDATLADICILLLGTPD